ncbi:MAG: polyhydroxyalkanoate depolymerase [Alphaproteobacteria bacterium]|nr:polyhydroxyalkanoate depolymerase [Alphaproteobacteria bacterium]
MLYNWYELSHAAAAPARAAAGNYEAFFKHPFNPFTHTSIGRHAAAACEVFERTTRRYAKPSFGLHSTVVDGNQVLVREETVWEKPFCKMIRFARSITDERNDRDPKILLAAPMSGHYATLLRGTVERFLPEYDVYITDWQDARSVPVSQGSFDLDSYIDYIQEMISYFGGDVHVFAVCQPSVPVLAAVSLMEADGDPNVPASLIFAGGPVDTRVNPTAVNELAEEKGSDWFASNAIEVVPWPNQGYGRSVYPGFLQLTGFMTMNVDRHMVAHKDMFMHLVHGDCDSAEKHRIFYDEYLAVMDLTAEFFLQTIDTVFVRHALPKGEMYHRGRRVDPGAIHRVALMTIEGEKDDITGIGQCRAAHDLTPRISADKRHHYEVPGVGHYGIFNGSRFRRDIAPRITQFVRTHDARAEHIVEVAKIDSRATKSAAHASACEISDVAFTFAAANDARPDPMVCRFKNSGLPLGTRPAAQADKQDHAAGIMAPFRLWALASSLIVHGLFGGR